MAGSEGRWQRGTPALPKASATFSGHLNHQAAGVHRQTAGCREFCNGKTFEILGDYRLAFTTGFPTLIPIYVSIWDLNTNIVEDKML